MQINVAEGEDNILDKFLKSTRQTYGKRDQCGPACLDFIDWAKKQGIELKRVRGEFVADQVVSAKADFTPEMKREFAQSGLDWNSAADRKAWIEQSKYAEEWHRVPHYWTVDKNGNIHDPSGYQQFVKTGLAKDLDPSRYKKQGVAEGTLNERRKSSMQIKLINKVGDYKQHVLHCTLEEIEAVLGPANCADDPDKVEYSWGFEVDGVRCGIWDYYRSYKHNEWSVFGAREVIEQVFPGKVIK